MAKSTSNKLNFSFLVLLPFDRCVICDSRRTVDKLRSTIVYISS